MVLATLVAITTLLTPDSLSQPIKITREQANYLKTEAKELRKNLKDTKKALRRLERKWWCFWCAREPQMLMGTLPPATYATATLENSISNALDSLENAKQEFRDQLSDAAQRTASDILFDTLTGSFKTIQDNLSSQSYDYRSYRERLFNLHLAAVNTLEFVASDQSLTYDLEIKSNPKYAAVWFKEPFDKDPTPWHDETDTKIPNLHYHDIEITAKLNGRVMKQTHSPCRESTHLLFFDFSK